jgi:sugar phosphate isomerase/epimerase
MKLTYGMSLWNYWHYVYVGSQEKAVEDISQFGFAVEAWYDPNMSPELAAALSKAGTVSVHATGAWMKDWAAESGKTLQDAFQMELDDCAAFGCQTIVLHGSQISRGDNVLDVDLAQFVVDYGREVGITVALENTLEEQGLSPAWEAAAIGRVDGLKICLDTGHVYWTDHSLADYLDLYKHHLVHLHVQDIVTPAEQETVAIYGIDHLQPGSGGISRDDWQLLLATLEEINFTGLAIFELRPRHPLQLGVLARNYFESLME